MEMEKSNIKKTSGKTKIYVETKEEKSWRRIEYSTMI